MWPWSRCKTRRNHPSDSHIFAAILCPLDTRTETQFKASDNLTATQHSFKPLTIVQNVRDHCENQFSSSTRSQPGFQFGFLFFPSVGAIFNTRVCVYIIVCSVVEEVTFRSLPQFVMADRNKNQPGSAERLLQTVLQEDFDAFTTTLSNAQPDEVYHLASVGRHLSTLQK